MRPTLIRSIRLIPKSSLEQQRINVLPPLPSLKSNASSNQPLPTIIDQLKARQASSPDAWPQNLRLEPVVKKDRLKHVDARIRPKLKQLLKEQ
ncbi:hypothetical protein K435DRAFT_680709 [Dendrothele bispora CBS 962.96]|uniref:Uncharacterized protein n=1 Tax=Dendrothele bispora (strain CBS 962.96) TaxID=1314807 RepID=A0A4S8LHD0_DENBC|nr:hypothetical protein K435DRAFT_680709 [Dendrothele bispora CBS 962.96]